MVSVEAVTIPVRSLYLSPTGLELCGMSLESHGTCLVTCKQRLLPRKPRVLESEEPGATPGLARLSFVTLDKSLNFSEFTFPHLLNGVSTLCLQRVVH